MTTKNLKYVIFIQKFGTKSYNLKVYGPMCKTIWEQNNMFSKFRDLFLSQAKCGDQCYKLAFLLISLSLYISMICLIN